MNGLTMDAFRSGKFSKGISAFTAFMFAFVFYLSPSASLVVQLAILPKFISDWAV